MTALQAGGLAGLVIGLFLYVGVMGLFAPNSMTGAMARFPARAGAASALTGAFRFGLGALSGLLVGVLHDGTALPMAGVILSSGVLSALSWVLLVRPGVRAATAP